MGWRWHDEDGDGNGGRGLSDIDGGGGMERAHFVTRRVVQSRCHTEEVEPGRFVRKCEKTEQLLRDCVGRPSELVESRTENTEEDVTDKIKGASHSIGFPTNEHSIGFPTNEPFAFPGLRADIEAIEKGLSGSLDSFMNEAEPIANNFMNEAEQIANNFSNFRNEAEQIANIFFKSFGFISTHDGASRPIPGRPEDRHIEEGTGKKASGNEYTETSSQITDV